jgi:hypothetical protein
MARGVREPSEVFSAILSGAADELAISSRVAAAFQHKGLKGDERAGALGDFLRSHLPGDFAVAKGEAIDFSDARSGQLDLIVYDRASSAPILMGTENVLVPCEALYVVIEVKTMLTGDELDSAYLNALKVRSLKPFKEPFVGTRLDGAPAKDGTSRCMYVVFAYETNLGEKDWLSKEFGRIQSAAKKNSAGLDVVDRVVVLDRAMINPGGAIGKESDGDDSDVFLDVFVHIVNFINRERLRRQPVDWQVYAARNSPGWTALV